MERKVYSPITGRAVSVTEVPDEVFSGKVLGDGVAVYPESSFVLAPFDGVISNIARTLHAICITGDNGIELLIHLGIDTVKLNGKGFTCYVEDGSRVRRGDWIMKMDLKLFKSNNFRMISPCIITNLADFTNPKIRLGEVTAAQSEIISCESAEAADD